MTEHSAAAAQEQANQALGERPRTLADFSEGAMGVMDLSIALRKEELLRLLLAGKRTREAAQVLGLSVGTVRTYVKCPEFQQKLWDADKRIWGQIDEEIRQSKLSTTLRIQELSELALERIAELMDSSDESIVYRASADILDRNPDTSKHSKQENSNLNYNINAEMLAAAAAAARELEARNVGRVIDGTPASS